MRHSLFKYGLTLALLAALTIAVFSGVMVTFDETILEAMRSNGKPLGPEWMPLLILGVTHSGDSITLIIIALLTLAYLYKKLDKGLFYKALIAYAGVFALTPLLKTIFGRARPEIIEQLSHASSASFPSGHALRSATVYLISYYLLSRFYPQLSRFGGLIILYVACIGLSRIYLGVHWPTDILASWLLTFGWLSFWYDRAEKG